MRSIFRSVSKVTSSSSRANSSQTWQWVGSALSSTLSEVFTPMVSYFNYWSSNTSTYEEQFIAKLQRYRNVVIDTQDGYITLELKTNTPGEEVLGIVNEYGKVTIFHAPWEQQLSLYLKRIKANIQYVEYGDLSDTWDEDDFTEFKIELVSQGLISEDADGDVLDFNDAEINKHVRFGGEDRSLKLDLYLKWMNRYGRPIDEQQEDASHPIRNLLVGGLAVSGMVLGSEYARKAVEQVFTKVSFGSQNGRDYGITCSGGLILGGLSSIFSERFTSTMPSLLSLSSALWCLSSKANGQVINGEIPNQLIQPGKPFSLNVNLTQLFNQAVTVVSL